MSYADVFLKKYRLLEEESQNKNPQVSPEAQKKYDELIEELKKLAYPKAIQYLDKIVKDDKLKFLLSLGFGGPLADTDMTSTKTALKCANLSPTQNEIDVDNSLAYLLYKEEGIDNIPNYFKNEPVTVVAPIVTFRNEYVIDGHHRWSQAYCANPNCKIVAINFDGDLSAQQMLKAAQATIASNKGEVPTQTVKGTNIYAASEDAIRKYITDKMTPAFEEAWKKALNKKEKNEVVDYLVKNCMQLKANNVPIQGAPKRDIMPQTSGSDIKDMSQGVTKI